jgi:hypothetical protein
MDAEMESKVARLPAWFLEMIIERKKTSGYVEEIPVTVDGRSCVKLCFAVIVRLPEGPPQTPEVQERRYFEAWDQIKAACPSMVSQHWIEHLQPTRIQSSGGH